MWLIGQRFDQYLTTLNVKTAPKSLDNTKGIQQPWNWTNQKLDSTL